MTYHVQRLDLETNTFRSVAVFKKRKDAETYLRHIPGFTESRIVPEEPEHVRETVPSPDPG